MTPSDQPVQSLDEDPEVIWYAGGGMLPNNVPHFCFFSKKSRIVICYAYLCCLKQTSDKSCWLSSQCEEKCVSSYLWGGRCREGQILQSNVPLEPSVVTAVSAILLQVTSKCSALSTHKAFSIVFVLYSQDQLCFSVQVQVQVVGLCWTCVYSMPTTKMLRLLGLPLLCFSW